MRKALHQVNFLGLPTAAFLSVAEECGFDAVELHPYETGESLGEVARATATAGLQVVSVSPLPDWFADPAVLSDSADRLLDAAVAVGAETLVAPAPVYMPGREPRPDRAAVIDALCLLHDVAAPRGVRLAFEPVGLSVKRPGAVGAIGDASDAAALVGETGRPIGLVLDSFCLGTGGSRLDEAPAIAGALIAGVQIADWDGVNLARREPGAGRLPLVSFVRHLDHLVTPFVSLEVFPLDFSAEPLRAAARIAALLAELQHG